MKSHLSLLLPVLLTGAAVQAQVTVVSPAPGTVITETVQTFDPVVVQRQLSLAPRMLVATPVTAPATAPVVTVTPGAESVQTTRTTTVIDEPGRQRRIYNSERSVVVVEDQNQSYELPYVTLPVLFEKQTADLLDINSRAALEQVAGVILTLNSTTPGTHFAIEGHASTDGSRELNNALSVARAQRIYDELTRRYGVPAELLSATGYGQDYPMFPQGTEQQRQQDRRVLVVRTK
jgi:outer membrane protein OmpA-like peptidoglycan-associated protein